MQDVLLIARIIYWRASLIQRSEIQTIVLLLVIISTTITKSLFPDGREKRDWEREEKYAIDSGH